MSHPRESETGIVKSAQRTIVVLEFVGERGSVKFNELLTELGLPRSSAHGLVQTLIACGWLEHDVEKRRYSLGLRAWQLGQRYRGHRDLTSVAKPIMTELAVMLGETVQLARLEGIENVYIAISDGPSPLRLAASVGMRLPSYGTGIGKALLAQLPREEARRRLSAVELPPFTEHTLTDVGQLMAALDAVARNGYALDDEEYAVGCRCVAVPLHLADDAMMVALSVTAPAFRCGEDWPRRPRRLLTDAATRIRAELDG